MTFSVTILDDWISAVSPSPSTTMFRETREMTNLWMTLNERKVKFILLSTWLTCAHVDAKSNISSGRGE